MKIPEQEIKKVRKTLLLNLVVADLFLGAGLIIYFWGGHKMQTSGIALIILGGAWTGMAISRMMRFKRFLAEQEKENPKS